MSDYQSVEASVVTKESAGSLIQLSDLKSLFYQLNAKPDTEIRLLPRGKTVELSDIRSINDQVGAKIRNYNVVAEIASVNFVLSNRKIKDFSTWAEFERERWDTVNERIESLSITWDMSLKLPSYDLPQRHSLKLRIGNAVPLKDMFQLAFTSDDITEIMEAGSHGICKVDFVNSIIAIELLNIVTNWHEGLNSFPEPVRIQQFLRKQGRLMSEILKYLFPVLLLVITCIYSDYLNPLLGIGTELSLSNIQKLSVFLTTIFAGGIITGRKIESSIDRKIDKFEDFPSFIIARGDEKAKEEFSRNNDKLTAQIRNKILSILFTFSITASLRFLIGYVKF
jgi:hypothetical protein